MLLVASLMERNKIIHKVEFQRIFQSSSCVFSSKVLLIKSKMIVLCVFSMLHLEHTCFTAFLSNFSVTILENIVSCRKGRVQIFLITSLSKFCF